MKSVVDLEPYVQLLTDYQSRIYAFIYTQLGDAELARDVFQETNLVLWRKAAEFDASREFLPWAFAIARNQIRATLQRAGRNRVLFDDEAMVRISENMAVRAPRLEDRHIALASCLQQLTDHDRRIVKLRYEQGESLRLIAKLVSRTPNAVGVTIHRIRQALAQCIKSKLANAAT